MESTVLEASNAWPIEKHVNKTNIDRRKSSICVDWYNDEGFQEPLAIDPPMIVFDNDGPETKLTVASSRKPGTLLKLVHYLSIRSHLLITKVRISTDDDFILDTFSLMDRNGEKITEEETLRKIQAYAYFLWNVQPPKSFNDCVNTEQADTLFPGWSADIIADLATVRASPPEEIRFRSSSRLGKSGHTSQSSCNSMDSSLSSSPCMSSSPRSVFRECSPVKSSYIPDRFYKDPVADPCPRTKSCDTGVDILPDLIEDYQERTSAPPEVTCMKFPSTSYLTVEVNCDDHFCLLFDILCALEDAQLDLFHAAIDTDLDLGVCSMEFQVTKRLIRGIKSGSPRKSFEVFGGVCEMSDFCWDELRDLASNSIHDAIRHNLCTHDMAICQCGVFSSESAESSEENIRC